MFSGQLILNNYIPDCINPLTWSIFSSENTKEEDEMKDKISKIAEQFGIEKEINVEISKDSDGQIFGNNLFPGSAGMIINTDNDEKTNDFIIKHEMTHLKNSDTLTIPIVELMSGLVGFLGTSYLFPTINPFFYFVAAMSVDVIVASAFSTWREEIADKTALENCDEETKQKALEYFENCIKHCINKRNEEGDELTCFWKKLKYSEEGNNRFDIFHPTHTERCRYIKEIIKKGT